MLKVYNGLCTTITVGSPPGAGSTITITHHEYPVTILLFVVCALCSHFLRDLRGLGDMSFAFELGKPFHPFEQLMGVLPSASKDHIPQAYQVCRLA